jgi:hypothetical protein
MAILGALSRLGVGNLAVSTAVTNKTAKIQ